MFHYRSPLRAITLAALLSAMSVSGYAATGRPTAEQQLLDAVQLMQAGDSEAARKTLKSLTSKYPNFQLANLVYGELLASLSGMRDDLPPIDKVNPLLRDLTEEGRLRLEGSQVPAAGAVPDVLLKLTPQHPYVIVVDLSRARLYLLHNDKSGRLTLVRQHYAAMGRGGYGKQTSGDLRTPLGVYHITGWLSGNKLPAMYGAGALPLNYPNLWDQFKKYSGSGIWLHGVPPDTYVRAPRSSEGCITMANEDLLALKPYVEKGEAPVIISDQIHWQDPGEAQKERDEFMARIEDWREKWSAIDTEGYLSLYGKDFTTGGMDRQSFAAHKRRINPAKKFIEATLTDINLFRYPGTGGDMMLAEFTLHYHSDNYSTVSQKQQFWRRDSSGEWKIFREENR